MQFVSINKANESIFELDPIDFDLFFSVAEIEAIF